MNKDAWIRFTTTKKLKLGMQRKAKQLGVPLSDLLNQMVFELANADEQLIAALKSRAAK